MSLGDLLCKFKIRLVCVKLSSPSQWTDDGFIKCVAHAAVLSDLEKRAQYDLFYLTALNAEVPLMPYTLILYL